MLSPNLVTSKRHSLLLQLSCQGRPVAEEFAGAFPIFYFIHLCHVHFNNFYFKINFCFNQENLSRMNYPSHCLIFIFLRKIQERDEQFLFKKLILTTINIFGFCWCLVLFCCHGLYDTNILSCEYIICSVSCQGRTD